MIEVVGVEKSKERKQKNEFPIPKFLKKYVPKKNFEKIFDEELRRIDGKGL